MYCTCACVCKLSDGGCRRTVRNGWVRRFPDLNGGVFDGFYTANKNTHDIIVIIWRFVGGIKQHVCTGKFNKHAYHSTTPIFLFGDDLILILIFDILKNILETF